MKVTPEAKISASIMCADFCNLRKVIKELEKAKVDYLHFDIMDGNFVPNFTLGPDILKNIKRITDIPFDTHLMIYEPIYYIDTFVEVGSDIITVHVEACKHLHRTISYIKAKGKKTGVALNPSTPICTLENILSEIDMVLIMTVNPGFAGQRFIPSMVEKVRQMRQIITEKKLTIDIEVDGSINETTAGLLREAGATVFVGGSTSIFKKNYSIIESTKKLRKYICGIE